MTALLSPKPTAATINAMTLPHLRITKETALKALVFGALLALYASLQLYTIDLPAGDDLPREMKIGQLVLAGNFDILYDNTFSYTEPQQIFYNHHWLSGVVFYLTWSVGGWYGLVFLKLLVLLGAFALIYLAALKKANFWLVSVCMFLALCLLSARTSLRPEIFSYLFVAIYFYMLLRFEEQPQSKAIFWLVPLQLVWVNIHVFFSIGIAMVGAFFFEKWYHTRDLRNPMVYTSGILTLLLAAVSLINPRGLLGVLYYYPSNFPVPISENRSLIDFLHMLPFLDKISVTSFVPLAVLCVASVGLLMWRARHSKKYPLFYAAAGVSTVALSVVIYRAIALFGLMFPLVVAAGLDTAWRRGRRWLEGYGLLWVWLRRIGIGIFLALIIALIYPGWEPFYRDLNRGLGLSPHAEESARFFTEHKLRGPILNNPEIGSYLIWYLYPQEKVFVDNRYADAYSAPFVGGVYIPMVTNEKAWPIGLSAFKFNTLFFYHYGGGSYVRNFIYYRMHDPEWVLVHVDPFAVIFVRNDPQNSAVIECCAITKKNIGERLSALANAPRFDDQATAADFFYLMGEVELANDRYFKILQQWPHEGKVWMTLAHIALGPGDKSGAELAAIYIQKAIAEGFVTAEAYATLGVAYSRTNQPELAKEALREALRLNPDREDAKNLLETLNP